jgi:two-component system, OmpR family, sensor histidine kinase KdpD
MEWFRAHLDPVSAPRPRQLTGYAVAAAGIVALTAALTPLRERIGLVTVDLLYLLLVVLVASRWGWGPGIFASVAANLTSNFAFVPPLYRFTVQEPENVVALVVFLLVAALTSWLLSRARAGEAAARRRQEETAILYELSRLIIVSEDIESLLGRLCGRMQDVFALDGCAVLTPAAGGSRRVVAATHAETAGPRSAYERHAIEDALTTARPQFLGGQGGRRRPRIVGRGQHERRAPVGYVPLLASGAAVGVLEVVGDLQPRVQTAEGLRLLEAFADVAALAVERDRLLREAARVAALQETDRLKSALMSAVSHDLRTPLTAILASVSSLLQPEVEWDDATRHEFLSAIESQTLRLTRLVNNLLDLSRIEGGALRPASGRHDVHELVEGAARSLEYVLENRRLAIDIAPDAGGARCDPVQIGQVLSNLIENAAKFSPPAGEIRVSAHRHAGTVVFYVDDQGPGILAGERELVFEKFYRVRRPGERAGGSGLGLAICKGLVEANGGTIEAGDSPLGGARFTVTLPAAGDDGSAIEALGRRQA